MPSPLVAHTVHDIIASVENESPSRPSLFGISSDRRLRRARTLVTEGLNILRLLGDELTARERVEYDTVHSLIENTMHTTTSAYLEAAERLWDFALVCPLKQSNGPETLIALLLYSARFRT
ncbi:hypothetical protein AcV7_003820 [Taiwanofungus camphoratus]|nr:hypothetical protein AcV7_003820 [Antrodia cinnamomea]